MKSTFALSLSLAMWMLSPAAPGQTTPLAITPKTLSIRQSKGGQILEIYVHGTTRGEHLMLVGYISILDNPHPTPLTQLLSAALADSMGRVTEDLAQYESALTPVVGRASPNQLFLSGTATQFSIPSDITYGVLSDFVGYSTSSSILPSLQWMTELSTVANGQSYLWQGSPPIAVPPNPPALVVPWLDMRVDPLRPGVFYNENVMRHLIANQFSVNSSTMSYGPYDEEVSHVIQAMRNGTIQAAMNMQLVTFDGTHVGGRPRVRISATHKPKIVLPLDPFERFPFRFRQGPGEVYQYPGLAGAMIRVEAETNFTREQVGNVQALIPTPSGFARQDAYVSEGLPWMDFPMPANAIDGRFGAVDRSVKPPVVVKLARYNQSASNVYADLKMYSAPN